MTTELPRTPPTPARTGRRGRLLALAVVLLAAGVVAAVLLWPEHRTVAAPPPPPSPTAPPSPSPSPSPTKVLPYPYFPAGTCFDHPQLSKGITQAVARPCEGPHDGEAIANPLLPDGLTKDSEIIVALQKTCQPSVTDWTARQGGGTWHHYPMGPSLAFYKQGLRDVTCTLTASAVQDGSKLTGHLKGYQG